MALKGMIFDLDGVLTDTAKYHYLAWKKIADSLGLSFNDADNELLKGVSRIRSFEIILELNNVSDKYSAEEKERLVNLKNEYYKEMIEQLTPKEILEGVLPLLSEAAENGIKCAVASVSKNAFRVLELLEIKNKFDYIADANAVTKSKPDPEIFLDCVCNMGLKPCECIGFEDSQAGIEAIHSAGMMSVGIGVAVTSVEPDMALKSTSELSFKKIADFYNNFISQCSEITDLTNIF